MPQASKKVADPKGQTEVRVGVRKVAGREQPAAAPDPSGVDPEVRLAMIREAAYYRALERGVGVGSPEQDWSEAEAEIDGMLSGISGRGH
ncbi:MAG: DUF2934 domain-containing protein [Deltaproteobacteria bacterium]|nr:DUF2934 domain-containing protein [Deltaproteobacteria bacterium]